MKVNVVANVVSNANATNLDKNDFAINGTVSVTALGQTINGTVKGSAKYIPGDPEVENGKYEVNANATLNGSFKF